MGQLTVGVAEGKIVVFYTVNEECDPEYQEAKWKKPEKPHCILHRLCVNPHFQHQGIARQAMEHIQRQAVEKGYQAIRLDVFSKNPHALKLYLGCGFEKVGSVRWRKGVFYLMEKYIIARSPALTSVWRLGRPEPQRGLHRSARPVYIVYSSCPSMYPFTVWHSPVHTFHIHTFHVCTFHIHTFHVHIFHVHTLSIIGRYICQTSLCQTEYQAHPAEPQYTDPFQDYAPETICTTRNPSMDHPHPQPPYQ